MTRQGHQRSPIPSPCHYQNLEFAAELRRADDKLVITHIRENETPGACLTELLNEPESKNYRQGKE
jgi:hypothetical protein